MLNIPRYSLMASLLFSSSAYCVDFSGYIGGQQRWFYESPIDTRQPDTPLSLNTELEWYTDWNGGNDSLVFKPYVRFDSSDSERTHGDIRELYWLHVSDSWEFGVGISKVYWGVAESQHLVDIINQTDLVEAPDGEEKLGQPMLSFSTIKDWGVVDLYVLPGFRPRTYPGEDGRLRASIIIDDHPEYESSAGNKHVDIAARWGHTLGSWDIGASFFQGTSREPSFTVVTKGSDVRLRPFYEQISQYGFDAQLTTGEWLWKAETIYRHSSSNDFAAFTGGFEYTLYSISSSAIDLGLIMEYLHDTRDQDASSGLQNDFFVGSRLSWNDAASSELLMGITQDLDDSKSFAGKVEANTRMGESAKIYFEAWFFNSDDSTDPLFSLRQDSFLELSVEYYF